VLLQVNTAAASTAWPLRVKARATDVLAVEEDGAVWMVAAPATALRIGYGAAAAIPETSSAPGGVFVVAQKSTDTTAGGAVAIAGGVSAGGIGGAVSIVGGQGDTTGGAVTLTGGIGGSGNGDINLNGTKIVANNAFWLYDAPLKTFANTPPTITADGGTGGTISGSNVAFQVTFGSGNPTSVTVDFGVAYAAAPMVVCSGYQSGQIVHIAAVSTTQVQISSSTAFSSGTKVNVFCTELAT